MDIKVAEQLLEQQLISTTEFNNIKEKARQPLSVYWELVSLLSLGIILLTTGLGILVYKNIESIGHAVIIGAISLACVACFAYCLNKVTGFSSNKVESPGFLFDYILLLGCLLLMILVGYIQFEYNLFGDHWGIATFIPMVVLFVAAYYFDHLGVLTLAITNLAAWIGITVTPLRFLKDNDFSSERLIYSGVLLGLGLASISTVSQVRSVKAHFAFTYKNFGAHILFISLLAAMFHFNRIYLVWFVILSAACILFTRDALTTKSFYLFVITVLYAYIAISYVVVDLLTRIDGDTGILYLGLIYFIVSGIALIRVLLHYNKILKNNASL